MNKRMALELAEDDIKSFLDEHDFYNYLDMFFNSYLNNADAIAEELGVGKEELVPMIRQEAERYLTEYFEMASPAEEEEMPVENTLDLEDNMEPQEDQLSIEEPELDELSDEMVSAEATEDIDKDEI